MATIPGAMLLCASSPHARRGALWDAYRKHHGVDGDDVLVWQAATREMNPTVPQSFIDKHVLEDPARAAAEYGAVFRVDLEAFVAREVLDRCVVVARRELPRIEGVRYCAFVDPSGGSANSMTLAICHVEGDGSGASRVVVDVVRERRPPFSPDAVVEEFSALLKAYDVTSVRGDRYAGEWPRERFAVHGIDYVAAGKPKSDLYRDLLPVLNSGRVELLDHAKLIVQLLGLERSTARGGRDSIDHAPGAHDDIANAVAGVIVTALAAVTQDAVIVAPIIGYGETRPIPGGSVLSTSVGVITPSGAQLAQGAQPPGSAHGGWAEWYYAGGDAKRPGWDNIPRGW